MYLSWRTGSFPAVSLSCWAAADGRSARLTAPQETPAGCKTMEYLHDQLIPSRPQHQHQLDRASTCWLEGAPRHGTSSVCSAEPRTALYLVPGSPGCRSPCIWADVCCCSLTDVDCYFPRSQRHTLILICSNFPTKQPHPFLSWCLWDYSLLHTRVGPLCTGIHGAIRMIPLEILLLSNRSIPTRVKTQQPISGE